MDTTTGQKTFSGIGADDKNGIYIILKLLEEAKEMKAVPICRGRNRMHRQQRGRYAIL